MKNHGAGRAILLAGMLTAVVLVGGCGGRTDKAELDLLLNEDAAFAELIRTKTNLEAQIGGIQQGLAERKSDMDQKITTLRQSFGVDRQSKEQIINEYRGLLKAQKTDFEAGYLKAKTQLEAQQKKRSDIERAIREAQAIIAKKDKLTITGKEIGEWEARIENLQNRVEPLNAEISTLELLVSIKHKKLKYL